MNEFDLIAKMRGRLARGDDRVVVWSGDDAAVVRPAGGVSVTSIDSFVEGVHFRLVTTSLRDLGHKCLAASLSDLAAMGALAGEAYVALGLPEHLGEREAIELAEGAGVLASRYGAAICGGDVTRADELFVTVAVVGYAETADDVVRRDGARAGDMLGVTGALGGSGAGRLLLEQKHPASAAGAKHATLGGGEAASMSVPGADVASGERLIERHLRPRPLLDTGRALARAGVHAMLDVSDGIASDCARLCERSGVGIEVTLADLPLDEGAAEVARDHGFDPFDFAATAGEDFELLFAAPPEQRAAVEDAAAQSGTSVAWIGRVFPPGEAPGEAVRLLDEKGRPRPLRGWDHLSRSASRSPGPA
jgi:thiamine-monophosphate kinase